MDIGKLPNRLLEEIVFKHIRYKRKDVLTRAGIGEDCAVLDYGEFGCVVSSDPITGATKNLGRLAVHISCNDVASNGAEPIGLLMTLLAPPSVTKEDIEQVMKDAGETAAAMSVEIIGGHTEITPAVNRMVVTTTVLGKQPKEQVLDPSKITVGDKILVTKSAGLEGTAIIAHEFEKALKESLKSEMIEEAKDFMESISVVKEGMLCGSLGVSYMHDITEGGVLGALWEASKAIDLGMNVYKERIQVAPSTKAICDHYKIDPLKLISSGSMLIIAPPDVSETVKSSLGDAGILVSEIGEITEEGIYMVDGDNREEIAAPGSDELYKVIK